MPRRPRRNHTRVFKSNIALAAIKGDKTVAELSQQFDVQANQITQWKTQLLERAGVVFEGGAHKESPLIDLRALHAKIGERWRMIF
jgi:transposase